METQVTTIEKMPLADMMVIGKLFAESGMFVDSKNQAQAVVKIMAGAEIGIPAFAAMSGIHIIQGKPTIGAGLIAARVKGSGKYDYRVIEQTDKNCSIDFFQGDKKIGNVAFSIDDAKRAGTKNLDKFPKNMLFARAISNGVKWFCPDVFSGPVYVPEEMEVTIDVPHVDMTPTPQPEITNHVHAVNAIKKEQTMVELKEHWARMNLETQSHPSVVDEIVSNLVERVKKSATEKELKDTWTAIGKIGTKKEFQANEAIVKAVKEVGELLKAPKP